MASQTLTQQRLRSLLNYNPDIGAFTRRITRGGVYAGATVGTVSTHGYVKIMVDGILYFEHHLAWLYVYGLLPESEIDHINRNRSDNRIENLRLASRLENMRNKGVTLRNTSGFKGVSWDKQTRKWRAQICINGKSKSIGRYEHISDAISRYLPYPDPDPRDLPIKDLAGYRVTTKGIVVFHTWPDVFREEIAAGANYR